MAEHDDDQELEHAGDGEPGGDDDQELEHAGDGDPGDDDEEELETDDEPGDDDESVVEEALVDFDERAIAAREKALEREDRRHQGALERAWGSLWAQFHTCPLCEGDGFMVPRQAGSMPEEQFAAVYAFAGMAQPTELPADQDYVTCENCKGWGSTSIAGAEREGLIKQCDRCLGLGYKKSTDITLVPTPLPIPGPVGAPQAPVIPSYGSPEPPDAWGRPAGHVHYGIPPAAVT